MMMMIYNKRNANRKCFYIVQIKDKECCWKMRKIKEVRYTNVRKLNKSNQYGFRFNVIFTSQQKQIMQNGVL